MSMINEGTLALREEIERLEKEIASLKDKLADQVVQVLAYKVLVSELDEEIASLKEQLKREQDCVDFYADKDNWVDMEVLGYLSSIRNDEQYGNEFGESKHLCVGGKLARSTQARREK